MSIDVLVIRGDGDIEGEPITDPLIGSEACAVERGRNVLDGASRLVTLTSINQIYDGTLRLGMLHQLEDKQAGVLRKHKVIGVRHTVSPVDGAVTIDTALRVSGSPEHMP
jgi:hypothetical protein